MSFGVSWLGLGASQLGFWGLVMNIGVSQLDFGISRCALESPSWVLGSLDVFWGLSVGFWSILMNIGVSQLDFGFSL